MPLQTVLLRPGILQVVAGEEMETTEQTVSPSALLFPLQPSVSLQGANIVPHCSVLKLQRQNGGFVVLLLLCSDNTY